MALALIFKGQLHRYFLRRLQIALRLQSLQQLARLFLTMFLLYLYRDDNLWIMAVMSQQRTPTADERLVSLAEHIQFSCSLHTPVLLQYRDSVVRSDVVFTIGGNAGQTGLHSSQLSSCAEITGHLSRSSIAASRKKRAELSFLKHLDRHSVDVKFRTCAICLWALWTDIDSLLVRLLPV